MTATGLLMCIVGWILVRQYGSPYGSISMFKVPYEIRHS
jgi:cytochrome b subunit of formate dehydrogenase